LSVLLYWLYEYENENIEFMAYFYYDPYVRVRYA
jgi:hypothetical protein